MRVYIQQSAKCQLVCSLCLHCDGKSWREAVQTEGYLLLNVFLNVVLCGPSIFTCIIYLLYTCNIISPPIHHMLFISLVVRHQITFVNLYRKLKDTNLLANKIECEIISYGAFPIPDPKSTLEYYSAYRKWVG